ncbi:MAG: AAA family ATPase [Rikenellaceae bacterium]
MKIDRIERLDIDNRDFFTAIYGVNQKGEYFIGQDLRKLNLWEALHIYLTSKGYTTIFYDDKAFSYDQQQLIKFYGFNVNKNVEQPGNETSNQPNNTRTNRKKDFFANKKSPFANGRKRTGGVVNKGNEENTNNTPQQPQEAQQPQQQGDVALHDSISIVNSNVIGRHYAVHNSIGFIDNVFGHIEKDISNKLAVIFLNPNTLSFNEGEQKVYENKLSHIRVAYKQHDIKLKLIAVYDYNNHEAFAKDMGTNSDKFLCRTPFKDLILTDMGSSAGAGNDSEVKKEIPRTVFIMPQPYKDEIANFINRRRLVNGLNYDFKSVAWDDLIIKLWQGVKLDKQSPELFLIRDLDDTGKLPNEKLEQIINKMNTDKAIDRFNKLQGIDNIKKQFEVYRQALQKQRCNPDGARFRPHMALLGSPGTGKTTVARLFGEILREDGLLPKGHFTKVDVSELVGEYVGSTRPKTRAVCERARGGVLFIDEAYGLMSGSNSEGHIDYGKEAIEVLIQFMEDNDDSLVILAGYTADIEELINKGNPGFRRRFSDLGFFDFRDYSAGVLYDIALKMIPKSCKYTPEFANALRNIIALKCAYKNKKFGNVGEIENLINLLVTNFESSNDAIMNINHIPNHMRALIDPSLLDQDSIFAELDSLIGQTTVKNYIKSLFDNVYANKYQLVKGEVDNPDIPKLNFIFSGNPGTGKTTIARLMGNILKEMGILSGGDDTLICLSGTQLKSAPTTKINEIFEDAIGRVLFIDEAYSMLGNSDAITTIVNNLTNKDYENKLCIILAGYNDDMRQLMESNVGFSSRFETVQFENYSDEELWNILMRYINNPNNASIMDDTCKEAAMTYFSSLDRDSNEFGNAREVENLFRILKRNRAIRYSKRVRENGDTTIDFARRILPEDFPN